MIAYQWHQEQEQTNHDTVHKPLTKEKQRNLVPLSQQGDQKTRQNPLNTTRDNEQGKHEKKKTKPVSSLKATNNNQHQNHCSTTISIKSILLAPNRHPGRAL